MLRLPRGVYTKIKTYPSGKRERLTLSPEGRVLTKTTIHSQAGKTKTGKRLARRRKWAFSRR